MADAASAVRVDPRPAFVRVDFGDARADFHYFWLRHHCECCRHPLTGERIVCASHVPLEIVPQSIRVDPEQATVAIAWPDGHCSTYAAAWLRAHAYALDRADEAPPAGDLAAITVERGAIRPPATLAGLGRDLVARHGALVVRNAGVDTEALIDNFVGAGWRVVPTHFGRIEDLRTDNTTNQNTDQLGYTDAAVELHTDQPFLDEPPRYQLLHCMQPADEGGDNFVVDAAQAARHLRSLDAPAFELLATVPVHFHRKQKAFERVVVSPIVEVRGGDVFRIRFSYFTMAPHRMPFAQMEPWYRAYQRLVHLMNAPQHQYRVRLAAGDFVLYDNFRMVHARTGFTGARWVRGVYFDEAGAK